MNNKEITLKELENFLAETPQMEWKGILISGEKIELKEWKNINAFIKLGMKQRELEAKWYEPLRRRILILLGRYNPAPVFELSNNIFYNEEDANKLGIKL